MVTLFFVYICFVIVLIISCTVYDVIPCIFNAIDNIIHYIICNSVTICIS